MPAKSPEQYKLMQGIAHGMKPTKVKGGGAGPSQAVAEEMIAKTSKKKRSEFAKSNPGNKY